VSPRSEPTRPWHRSAWRQLSPQSQLPDTKSCGRPNAINATKIMRLIGCPPLLINRPQNPPRPPCQNNPWVDA
jgi:hypothetical protein